MDRIRTSAPATAPKTASKVWASPLDRKNATTTSSTRRHSGARCSATERGAVRARKQRAHKAHAEHSIAYRRRGERRSADGWKPRLGCILWPTARAPLLPQHHLTANQADLRVRAPTPVSNPARPSRFTMARARTPLTSCTVLVFTTRQRSNTGPMARDDRPTNVMLPIFRVCARQYTARNERMHNTQQRHTHTLGHGHTASDTRTTRLAHHASLRRADGDAHICPIATFAGQRCIDRLAEGLWQSQRGRDRLCGCGGRQ